MCDYSKGKIYKLFNTITDDIYIGATTRPLNDRLAEHRRAGKKTRKSKYIITSNYFFINIFYIYIYKQHGSD